MSFGEEDYQRIQTVCEHYGMSEAEVVRGSVSKGLGAYAPGIHKRIRKAAEEFGVDDHVVVLGAIREGLEEYRRQFRSTHRLAQLRQLKEDLGEDEEDRDLNKALREYLERHSDVLEGLMEEEEFFQKTIDREDEQQEEDDRELQADFDKVTGKRSDP